MQGLVVVGFIFKELSHVNVKCVKVTGEQKKVNVTWSRYLLSQY